MTLRLDVDSDDGPTLGIESVFEIPEGGSPKDFALGGLDQAHDKLIETFLSYTSKEMHTKWGKQE